MTRRLGLSKLRSDRIFVNFSLQCKLELEDRCMVKRKMYWDRSKSFICLREFVVSFLIQDLHHRQPRRWLLSLGRGSQRDTQAELIIWNLGTHDFRDDFTIFFIYMNSYMNSWSWRISWNHMSEFICMNSSLNYAGEFMIMKSYMNS